MQSLSLSPQATQLLVRYPWPGNVRELEHVIYRATIVARAGGTSGDLVLRPEHLNLDGVLPDEPHPADVENTAPSWRGVSLRDATEHYQRQVISDTLARHQGNWSSCARELAVDSGNLHRMAKRLGIK
ncbi:hypothetical protein OS11_10500 [Dickeya oryzae]